MSTDLVPREPAPVVRAPLPVYSPEQMVEELTRYRALQRALDAAMPDAIITIGDRQFRRKPFWRAIALAFGISVELLDERREVQGTFDDGQLNFGYLVTYRASAPNGRAAVGDGAAFAAEKAARFRCPHPHPTREGKTLHYPGETCPDFDARHIWRTLPATATEHFIRSFAHSRAYSRAISNLSGFAETPAEEVELTERDEAARPSRRAPEPHRQATTWRRVPPRRVARTPATIDAQQQRRMFERWREVGGTDEEALRVWFARQGITDTAAIRCADYDDLIGQLLIDRPGVTAAAAPPADPRVHRALAITPHAGS